MSEIADKVKKIVVEHLGVEEAKVTPKPRSSMISAPTASTPSNW